MLVRNITTKFGENAGKIWASLEEEGQSKEKSILKSTQLNEKEFYTGIGWLARENKIRKEKNKFTLGETNLDHSVGTNAGRIWKILDIWEEADIVTLKKLADVSEEDVYAALGWLGREDKIEVDANKNYRLRE